VLEGRMGALLGDDVVEAGPGDLVYKPRGQWHTFWNAGDEPARILEIISPAGFERFFAELAPLADGGAPEPSASSASATPWTCSPRPSPRSAAASESGSRASSSAATAEAETHSRSDKTTASCTPSGSPSSRARRGGQLDECFHVEML
jgi:Cupin domain